jgi:hypothetical protein
LEPTTEPAPLPTRYICTAEAPWTPDKGRSVHPDAVYVEDRDYGLGENVAVYRCLHCGKVFEEELPQ